MRFGRVYNKRSRKSTNSCQPRLTIPYSGFILSIQRVQSHERCRSSEGTPRSGRRRPNRPHHISLARCQGILPTAGKGKAMILSAPDHPVNGMMEPVLGHISHTDAERPTTAAAPVTGPELVGELVGLYRSNDYLLSELKALNLRLIGARDYLRSPDRNPVLAEAH